MKDEALTSLASKRRSTTALHTAAEVRELDRRAAAEGGLAGAELMERAGARAWSALARRWPGVSRIAIVCGMGNNGGDGFVVARHARRGGCEVRALGIGDPDRLGPDARAKRRAMEGEGVPLEPFSPDALDGAGVVVDALFGTGLSRPVTGPAGVAIATMNAGPAPVLAIDIPSGLDADTGKVLGAAVRATLTVTFIGRKRGLHTGEGPDCCGAIEFDSLGVSERILNAVPASARGLDYDTLVDDEFFAPRRRSTHKGHHGHVLLAGGDAGYSGAVRLAAEAAARVGSGLVSVATREVHAATVSAARPEIMSRGVEDEAALVALAARASVIAIGPGLGLAAWGEWCFARVLALPGRPLVVDADALNHLAAMGASAPAREDWILTPHPGEAGRLLGVTSAEIQADRFSAATEVRARYGGVCVLKGAGTIVAIGTGPPGVCVNGNPGMATGGTGDVLTGVLAGLLAQGVSPARAAALGVCIHGKSGDRAAKGGERGLLAGDLLAELRGLVNRG